MQAPYDLMTAFLPTEQYSRRDFQSRTEKGRPYRFLHKQKTARRRSFLRRQAISTK